MTYRMPKLEEYIAGALLSNAPGWLVIALISYIAEYIETTILFAEALIVVSYLISTTVSSYLICRIAYRDRMTIGLTVGVSAILVNMLFTLLIRGMPMQLLIEIVSVQILGGVLGAYIIERRNPSTSY
ncbi:MAG: hypothetical protein QXO82_06615 [Candidatus Methanomethylicia archaeon]